MSTSFHFKTKYAFTFTETKKIILTTKINKINNTEKTQQTRDK